MNILRTLLERSYFFGKTVEECPLLKLDADTFLVLRLGPNILLQQTPLRAIPILRHRLLHLFQLRSYHAKALVTTVLHARHPTLVSHLVAVKTPLRPLLRALPSHIFALGLHSLRNARRLQSRHSDQQSKSLAQELPRRPLADFIPLRPVQQHPLRQHQSERALLRRRQRRLDYQQILPERLRGRVRKCRQCGEEGGGD